MFSCSLTSAFTNFITKKLKDCKIIYTYEIPFSEFKKNVEQIKNIHVKKLPRSIQQSWANL